MSQTTVLPLLQCWQSKISIINWWLNKDNILFPKRPRRLWSWSFSTAIFIRPQLSEGTTPPAGQIHIWFLALLVFIVLFLNPCNHCPLWFLWCPCWKWKTNWPGFFFFTARKEELMLVSSGLLNGGVFFKNNMVLLLNGCVTIYRPHSYYLIADKHSDATTCLFQSKVSFIERWDLLRWTRKSWRSAQLNACIRRSWQMALCFPLCFWELPHLLLM